MLGQGRGGGAEGAFSFPNTQAGEKQSTQMSDTQRLGQMFLSLAGHQRLSVLACLDLHVCLPWRVNQPGRAGMQGGGHTRGAM